MSIMLSSVGMPRMHGLMSRLALRIYNRSYATWYAPLPVPHKSPSNEIFSCTTFNEDHIAVPRCKVSAKLTDDSRTIRAIFFDKSAETLLHRTIVELLSMQDHGFNQLLDETEKWLQDHMIIAELKAQQNRFTDHITRYTVQNWTLKASPGKNLKTLLHRARPMQRCQISTSTVQAPPHLK